MNETRRELERLWRERPCLQPNHKLGIVKLTDELIERGGYWIIPGFAVVMKRGKKYPGKRAKLRGPAPLFLTTRGYLYAEHVRAVRDRKAPETPPEWKARGIKQKLTVVLT